MSFLRERRTALTVTTTAMAMLAPLVLSAEGCREQVQTYVMTVEMYAV